MLDSELYKYWPSTISLIPHSFFPSPDILHICDLPALYNPVVDSRKFPARPII